MDIAPAVVNTRAMDALNAASRDDGRRFDRTSPRLSVAVGRCGTVRLVPVRLPVASQAADISMRVPGLHSDYRVNGHGRDGAAERISFASSATASRIIVTSPDEGGVSIGKTGK